MLAELPGIAAGPALRGGHAGVLRALREALVSAPGAVWSALRRPTVGTLIRCLRAGPRADWLVELDATLAVELAVAGALTRVVVVQAPPRVVCVGLRRSFSLTPGVLRCVAGEVVHRDAARRETVLVAGKAVAGVPSHVEIAGGLLGFALAGREREQGGEGEARAEREHRGQRARIVESGGGGHDVAWAPCSAAGSGRSGGGRHGVAWGGVLRRPGPPRGRTRGRSR